MLPASSLLPLRLEQLLALAIARHRCLRGYLSFACCFRISRAVGFRQLEGIPLKTFPLSIRPD